MYFVAAIIFFLIMNQKLFWRAAVGELKIKIKMPAKKPCHKISQKTKKSNII